MFASTPGAPSPGGGATRDLTYRVKVVADTSQATTEFQRMGSLAQQAAQAAQARYQPAHPLPAYMQQPTHYQMPAHYQLPAYMQQHVHPQPAYMQAQQSGGAVGGGTQAGGGRGSGSVAADTAFLQGFSATVAKLGVAVAFVTQSMEKLRAVVDAASLSGRETVTAQTKMEAWFNTVPVVGGPVGQAMSYGAGLQEHFGRNNGYGYLAKADAKGRTFEEQEKARDNPWVKYGKLGLGILAPGPSMALDAIAGPNWLAGTVGELTAANKEYTEAEDRIFRTPYDIARAQVGWNHQRQLDRQTDEYRRFTNTSVAQTETAREMSRFLIPRGREGSAPYYGGSGRVRFDERDSYDSIIRDAAKGLVGAQGDVSLARTEALRATSERQAWDRSLAGSQSAMVKAQKEADKMAELQKYDPAIQKEATKTRSEAERAAADFAERQVEHQKALNREREKTVSLAQAEYELGQKSLAVQQAKLSVVESKLKTNDGYTESFAFMKASERSALLDATRQLNESDFDSLSPRQRELLAGSSLTHDYLNKKAREFVRGDNELSGGLNDLLTATGQQTRRELMEQQKALQAKIELEFVANPEKLAEAMKKAFQTLNPLFREMFLEIANQERAKINRQQAAAQAQKGGSN